MKKLFYVLLSTLFLTLHLVSCASFGKEPIYNTVSTEALSVSYSYDGEEFRELPRETPLFRKRIYAARDGEKIYLSVKNISQEHARVSFAVDAGRILPPEGLYYGYGIEKEEVSHWYALGEEAADVYILAPEEETVFALSLQTDEDVMGVVSPLLSLSVFGETMHYDFDISDPSSFVMQTGKEFSSRLPQGVKRIVFSDRADPKGAVLTDFSLAQNGAVVGWEEDGVYTVSTRLKGQKAIANDNSSYLFADLEQLEEIDLHGLDTSKTRDFMRFFSKCSSLKSVDLSALDTSMAVRTRSMFNGCRSLTALDFSEWETISLVDVSYMFAGTYALEAIDLSHLDFSNVRYTSAMFQSSGVKTLRLPSSLTSLDGFFFNHTNRYESSYFTIAKEVVSIGRAHCFYDFGTDAFCAFLVEEGNTGVCAKDGVLYSADGKVLLALPKGKKFENGVFEIPEGVELFGELSFSRNPYVKTLLLPNSYRVKIYTEVDDVDFCDDGGNGNLNVGNSLNVAIYIHTGIEAYAVKADNPFYTAHGGLLYEKSLGGSAKVLVAVPTHVKGVIDIPEGVTQIADEAFWEDAEVLFEGIEEIHLPKSLTEMGDGQLEKINSLGIPLFVAEGNAVYTVRDGKIVLK